MSEEIENNTINFLYKNNKNISSIVFNHVTYTAIITLVDKSVRVLNLDTSDNNSLDSISDNNAQNRLQANNHVISPNSNRQDSDDNNSEDLNNNDQDSDDNSSEDLNNNDLQSNDQSNEINNSSSSNNRNETEILDVVIPPNSLKRKVSVFDYENNQPLKLKRLEGTLSSSSSDFIPSPSPTSNLKSTYERSPENITSPTYILDNELESDKQNDTVESTSDNSNKNNAESSDNPNDMDSIINNKPSKVERLKQAFMDTTKKELIMYNNQLFSTNSVLSFLTTNFDHLFFSNDDEVIYSPQDELPDYSIQNTESIYGYLKNWYLLYDKLGSAKHMIEESRLHMLYDLRGPYISLAVILATEYKEVNGEFPHYKTLRGLISNKVQTLFGVVDRHERRYWIGTWRLIEFLHITQCPAMILVKSGLTTNYFMSTTNKKYDKFLQSLLKDKQVVHQTPKFDET
ncbi:11977_t:CDS:2, partial [Dentiscutata heterogama]